MIKKRMPDIISHLQNYLVKFMGHVVEGERVPVGVMDSVVQDLFKKGDSSEFLRNGEVLGGVRIFRGNRHRDNGMVRES